MAYRIVRKDILNSVSTRIDVEAPLVAKKARAGQFVMLRIDEKGERIPLTIARKDTSSGTVSLVFQIAGKTTRELANLDPGNELADLIGPMGRATDLENAKNIVFVGGGIGIAEILPVIEHAKERNIDVTTVLGARTGELLIFTDAIKKLSRETFLVTDDGSVGEKGLVTGPLKKLLEKNTYDLCYAVGPDIMMKAVCDLTKEYGTRTLVSLDANMVDATGMCGTCRVTVRGKVKFTCVDGPEFDGHGVDWDEFMKRQKRFAEEEKRSDELYKTKHICRKQNTKSRIPGQG